VASASCVIAQNRGGGVVFINECPYSVILTYDSSSVGKGGIGPLGAGQEEMSAVPAGDHVEWWVCGYDDWVNSSCSLP